MFKKRLITALILIPLVLGLIYFASPTVMSLAILLLFLALSWEWLSLVPIENLIYKIIAIFAILLIFLANVQYWDIFLQINFVVWGFIIVAILTYPKSEKIWGNPYVVSLFSAFVLTTFLSILYVFILEDESSDEFVYLLLLVWAADIGAYLSGKKFGKIKLIPNVSPGKTIEGTIGGLALALLVAAGGYWYFKPERIDLWFLHAAVVVALAIFGDLFISMLKRRAHVKDTGSILPGHGGVLDRLDSLIAALPFFYYFQGM